MQYLKENTCVRNFRFISITVVLKKSYFWKEKANNDPKFVFAEFDVLDFFVTRSIS